MRPDDLCGDARLYISRYDRIRNAYVYLMAKGAYGAITAHTGRRQTLVVSGNTFPGIGKFSAYWISNRGNGTSDLKRAIRDLQLFNMLGLPWLGIAPCMVSEAHGDRTLALCCLWLYLAAFLPVMQVVELPKAATKLEALGGSRTRPEDSTVAWTPVPVYLPAGVWYEWYQGYNITLRRGLLTNATATKQRAVTLFLRGGGVLVTTSPS
ncbi:hypothetical protein V5799_024234, partial [Amblyomma americanum]